MMIAERRDLADAVREFTRPTRDSDPMGQLTAFGADRRTSRSPPPRGTRARFQVRHVMIAERIAGSSVDCYRAPTPRRRKLGGSRVPRGTAAQWGHPTAFGGDRRTSRSPPPARPRGAARDDRRAHRRIFGGLLPSAETSLTLAREHSRPTWDSSPMGELTAFGGDRRTSRWPPPRGHRARPRGAARDDRRAHRRIFSGLLPSADLADAGAGALTSHAGQQPDG